MVSKITRAPALHKVVFIRHGQSTWNLENRFTGWHDVDLTEQGVQEAKSAGTMLKEKTSREGIKFSVSGDGYPQTSTAEADCCDISFKMMGNDAANVLTGNEYVLNCTQTPMLKNKIGTMVANQCQFIFHVELLV